MFSCAPSPAVIAAAAKKIAGLVPQPAVSAIVNALLASEVVHYDETGFRVAGDAGMGALGLGGEAPC